MSEQERLFEYGPPKVKLLMSEEEWQTAEHPTEMVVHLRAVKASDRKFRLLAIECVRRIRPHLADPRSIRALEFMEVNAERPFKGLRHLRRVHCAAFDAHREAEQARQGPSADRSKYTQLVVQNYAATATIELFRDEAHSAAFGCSRNAEQVVHFAAAEQSGFQGQAEFNFMREAEEARRRLHIALVRDIFGNPFQPVDFSTEWRTDTCATLAAQMYDSRDFGAMPILADALQDAGCDNDDILNHCRDEKATHVRGCWVVDLVLDKA
jgi:hypothetical protein